MKKRTILCAVIAVALVCAVFAACGMRDGGGTTTTTTTTTTERRGQEDTTLTTRDDSFSEMWRDNAETVSEMFSEAGSELRDRSFLDPQNGIISDTQPNP